MDNTPKQINPETLYQQYLIEGLSPKHLSEYYSTSLPYIYKMLSRYNLLHKQRSRQLLLLETDMHPDFQLIQRGEKTN
jgi:hypothetical protein